MPLDYGKWNRRFGLQIYVQRKEMVLCYRYEFFQ